MTLKVMQLAYKATIEGGEMVLLQLARGLQRRGCEVHVCAPTPGPLLERLASEGCRIAAIPAAHLYSLGGMRQLRRYWKEHGIALAQAHGRLPNLVSRLAKRGAAEPKLVSTEHCVGRLAWGGHGTGSADRFKAGAYHRVDNFTARWCDRIVCVSESVKRDKLAQGLPEEKLRVIANGIELSAFVAPGESRREELRARARRELRLPETAAVIGTVCRLDGNKNPAALVRMMPEIWRETPEARLVLLGDGPERERLQQLAAGLERPEQIRFAGYRADVPELLPGFDVAAFASNSEGFGLALIEALASGVPVVTTEIPSVCEFGYCAEGAEVVENCAPATMAGACLKFLRDERLRRRAGFAGRRFVENRFATETMVENTVKLYSELGVCGFST